MADQIEEIQRAARRRRLADAAKRVALEIAKDDGFFFVGECRSPTAKRKGWTWKDGRLAAKPLFEALAAMKIDPGAHVFLNLWTDDTVRPTIPWQRVERIRAAAVAGIIVVALGKRVSVELAKRGIEHVALVHPAARGKIRRRDRYIAHVKDKFANRKKTTP